MNTGIHAKKRMAFLFKLMWYEVSYLLVVWSQVDYNKFVGYKVSLHFLILIPSKNIKILNINGDPCSSIGSKPNLSAVVAWQSQRLGFGMSTSKRLLRYLWELEGGNLWFFFKQRLISWWVVDDSCLKCIEIVRNLDEWFVVVFWWVDLILIFDLVSIELILGVQHSSWHPGLIRRHEHQ